MFGYYYQVVIVGLDCSYDIQQIKLKGDILSLVTRSRWERKSVLFCRMLTVYKVSVLNVSGEVCRGCEGVLQYREHSYTSSQKEKKQTVRICFVLLFITCVFLLSLNLTFSSSELGYCAELRFTKSSRPLCP